MAALEDEGLFGNPQKIQRTSCTAVGQVEAANADELMDANVAQLRAVKALSGLGTHIDCGVLLL